MEEEEEEEKASSLLVRRVASGQPADRPYTLNPKPLA